LVRRNGKQGVFIADADAKKARFVPVETGFEEGDYVEIVRPQLNGMVVTLGQHLLEDGAAISLPQFNSNGSKQTAPPSSEKDQGSSSKER